MASATVAADLGEPLDVQSDLTPKITFDGVVLINDVTEGGIIYFSTNLVSTDQVTEMIQNIQTYSKEATGRGLFIGVDEEGGTVARVADTLGTTQFDDMSVYGESGDTAEAYNIGSTQAKELSALGFNVNFSPVADVLTNEDNTVVKERSFGSDPDLVSGMVTQVVKGLTDGGMLCAPKHFPGHGSTGGDTHDGFASSDRTLEELEACDFKPFEAAIAAGAPMVMVGHMTMTAIDEDSPASLSHEIVTGLLREQLGYDGIIITDALNMDAITDNDTMVNDFIDCDSNQGINYALEDTEGDSTMWEALFFIIIVITKEFFF